MFAFVSLPILVLYTLAVLSSALTVFFLIFVGSDTIIAFSQMVKSIFTTPKGFFTTSSNIPAVKERLFTLFLPFLALIVLAIISSWLWLAAAGVSAFAGE